MRLWNRKKDTTRPGAATNAEPPAAILGAVSERRAFLKTMVMALGGATATQLAAGARPAQATYIPGSPSDTVDTNLTVQGNLIVGPTGASSMAVGTSTIQGKLNVAGDVWINGTQAIGPDGIVKQSYYAQ